MQGKNENLLSSTDKIRALKEKPKVWSLKVKNGTYETFYHYSERKNKEITSLITEHPVSLEENLEKYFPSLCTDNYAWIRNPFLPQDAYVSLNWKEEEELIDIRNDGNLKVMYKGMPLSEFWIKIRNRYSCIGDKAVTILLQFSTSYMCEIGFSILTSIKTKKRERLLEIEEEMRVAISNVRPDIERICAKNQAQVSH